MSRYLVVVCAVVVSACGQTGFSPSPVTVTASESLPLQTECAVASPRGFAVEPRNANAYLSWAAVDGAESYAIEIYETGSGALVGTHVTSSTQWEWGAPGLGQGPYRARVRAQGSCGVSEWTADDVFILNRFGGSGSATPDPDPFPAPAPTPTPMPPAPVPPSPAPPVVPPAPLVACGTLKGHHVVNLLGTTFKRGMAPVRAAVSLPAGTYQVEVETNDAKHRAGYQVSQTSEVVTLRGIGTTSDIPETTPRHVTTFTATLPVLAELVVEAGRDSVHGVCVAFTSR